MVALVALVVVFGIFVSRDEQSVQNVRVTNFEECAEAGFPIMESYPEQCSNGEETFTRDIGNELEKNDLIRLDNPRPGDFLSHNEVYEISGEARGYWFFEASFPIEVLSEDGDQLFLHYAVAEDDWMTEDFVSFSAEIKLETDYTGPASLILRRDNPSDLPENDDELIVPIKITANESLEMEPGEGGAGQQTQKDGSGNTTASSDDCFVGGCSGQICSEDPDAISNCEWREEYGCYNNATCERQVDGECGWTETPELSQCLAESEGRMSL